MAYASLAELRALLRLATAETGDDTLLTNELTYAQAFIESPQCCNRVFEASSDTTRYLNAETQVHDLRLMLDYDLCSIKTVTCDGTVIPSSAYVTCPTNTTPYWALELYASQGYTWGYSSDPQKAIAIEGKWAYSTTAPSAIKDATLLLAKWKYRQLSNDADAERPILSADGTILMPSALPRVFWDLVQGYRRP